MFSLFVEKDSSFDFEVLGLKERVFGREAA
jgi:hypothetical protein